MCHHDGQAALLAEAAEFAQRLGPLLSSFTGEHVGEPRLHICLYGPPLLHVDLKFVRLGDLATRVEDGLVLWERIPETVAHATAGTLAAWPMPSLQWLEDRFWTWVHYAAAKIGRGELFECLDACAYFRSAVLGPLLAVDRKRRPQGVRRLELYAGDALPELRQTVGNHTRDGCVRALRASITLYKRLRDRLDDGTLIRRTTVELATLEYFDQIAGRASGQTNAGGETQPSG